MISGAQQGALASISFDNGIVDEELLSSLAPFVPPSTTSSNVSSLLCTYQVAYTAAKIIEAGYSRIALQFPDEYLADAPVVCAALSNLLGTSALVFVLGDTSYGACCADEVAAQHLDAHAIIHYGNACLSPTRALPVLYVFPHANNADNLVAVPSVLRKAVQSVSDAVPDAGRIVVLYDVELSQVLQGANIAPTGDAPSVQVDVAKPRAGDLLDFMPPLGDNVAPVRNWHHEENEEEYVEVAALRFLKSDVPLSEVAVLWVCSGASDGDLSQSPALRNAALLLASGLTGSCRAFYRIGLGGEIDIVNGSRLLRLRSREVGRVREAERIGVVAGSLAVAGVTEAIERVVRIIEDAGKRAYVLLVGKISPTKLHNFEEMDAFVIVACPLRAIMNSKEFLVPLVTPLEIDVALGGHELFDRSYSADFRELATGEGSREEDNMVKGRTVAERAELKVAVSAPGGAAAFYKDRAWKGLVRDKGGMDEDVSIHELSTKAVRGSSGIAMRYDRETEKSE